VRLAPVLTRLHITLKFSAPVCDVVVNV